MIMRTSITISQKFVSLHGMKALLLNKDPRRDVFKSHIHFVLFISSFHENDTNPVSLCLSYNTTLDVQIIYLDTFFHVV